MRTFSEQVELDINNAFMNADEFAQRIIYDDGSVQKEIVAVFSPGGDGQKHEGDHALVQVKKSDVINPKHNQTFIIHNQNYKIINDSNEDNILSLDDYTWQIKITANERFEGWRT